MTEMRQQITRSSILSAGVLLAAVLIGIINYFGWKYYQRFDWTRAELYSLSGKTANLMATLDRDVEAIVFMGPENPLFDAVTELMSGYQAASPRFSSRVVDPAKNLMEAQSIVDRFQLAQVDVIVMKSGDDRHIIESTDLAEYDYSGLQFGQGPQMTGFKGEQALTGALLELMEESTPRVLFTVGHGELRLDELSSQGLSQAADLLRQDNFELEEWRSLGEPEVPADTSLVVVAGPTSNFIEPELQAFERYLEAGGRMLVLLDPVIGAGVIARTGIEDLLAAYGVTAGDDIVLDPSNPIPFYGAETIFVDAYGDHPITRSLDQAAIPLILPLARSVGRSAEEIEGVSVTELARTSEAGWAERGLDALDRVEFDGDDLAGPVSIAVAVTAESSSLTDVVSGGEGVGEAAESRMIAVGDADFATNGQLVNVGNAEMLLGAVNWLVERESLLGIPPKAPDQVRLNLTAGQLSSVAWLVFAIMPGLAVLAGVMVYLRRRR